MINRVIIQGRLVKDPDVRYGGENQQCIARFNLAVERNTRDKQTDFPTVVCFGKTGEAVEKYCKKGQMVLVEGSIQTGSYTDREGHKVYTTNVIASRVEFLERPKKEEKAEEQTTMFEMVDEELPF